MMDFWIAALGLSLIALLVVVLPLYRAGKRQRQDELTNTRIVRQRLQELEREQQEGLISEADKQQAITELKLALVDEAREEAKAKKISVPAVCLAFGALVALGMFVYSQANQLTQISHLQQAQERLPELSRRIVMEADTSITPEDMQDFALGVRSRLKDNPNDFTGWMLLGRLHMSLRQLEPAFQAFDKSLELNPNNTGVLSSYSQALLMTGQQEHIAKSADMLQRLVQLQPDNDNAVLMLTLAASELGELDLARQQFAKLQGKLPESDPIYKSLSEKLGAQTTAVAKAGPQKTGFVIDVALDQQLQAKLPADGYLFVFAQDADSAMRMPAAVVRLPLDTLPVRVQLSDDNAMMPEFKLSQLKNTRLVARISRDQNVAQTAGELQGETIARVTQGVETAHTITINKEIM